MTYSILILGGTAEAKALAAKLKSEPDCSILLSLAGRTQNPAPQPVPVRSGGFGGAEGLADFLRDNGIDLLIDATHPFAARISRNAAEAAAITGVPLFAMHRPAWSRMEGDRWLEVVDIDAAVEALGDTPRRIFLTLGRQELLPFERAKGHHYVVRSVDPVEPRLQLPDVTYLTARGPFLEADEIALLTSHGIDLIVSKNSGGPSSYGKITAARKLAIDVVLVERPPLPEVPAAETVDALVEMVRQLLSHWAVSRK